MTSHRKTTHARSHISLPGGIAAKSANGGALASTLVPAANRRGAVLVGRLIDVLLCWQERRRQRRQLAMLDDHMLRDLGLSSADVEHEVHKPFWRM